MKSFHPSRLDKMSTWRYYPIRKDFLRSLSLKLARLAYGKMGRALPAGIRENGSAVAQAAGQLSSAAVVRQGKLGVFWQGESPCGVRANHPPLPSVASVKEAKRR